MPVTEKLSFYRDVFRKAWKKLSEKFVLPTSTCKVCFKQISPQSWLHLFLPKAHICSSCFRSFSPKFKAITLEGVNGLSVYTYDETIREKLFQLKGCFDLELAPIFLEYFKRELRWTFRNFIIVPAPSWEGDDRVREFNHVIEIFKILNIPIQKALVKAEKVKQTDLNYEQRQNISKRLQISPQAKVKGKNVLFVDDVLTSGATAKACIHLLRQAGAKQIRLLVMAKTKKPEEKTSISKKEKEHEANH